MKRLFDRDLSSPITLFRADSDVACTLDASSELARVLAVRLALALGRLRLARSPTCERVRARGPTGLSLCPIRRAV